MFLTGRSEDALRTFRGRSEEMHNCFMLAFLGLCHPLRTLRGNPRVGLCSASLILSLFDRAHTRTESARSSTVMYASDAHADLATRPHTSHTQYTGRGPNQLFTGGTPRRA